VVGAARATYPGVGRARVVVGQCARCLAGAAPSLRATGGRRRAPWVGVGGAEASACASPWASACRCRQASRRAGLAAKGGRRARRCTCGGAAHPFCFDPTWAWWRSPSCLQAPSSPGQPHRQQTGRPMDLPAAAAAAAASGVAVPAAGRAG
jgi:hypothetical protein